MGFTWNYEEKITGAFPSGFMSLIVSMIDCKVYKIKDAMKNIKYPQYAAPLLMIPPGKEAPAPMTGMRKDTRFDELLVLHNLGS